jgi:hypothetical protein
MEELESPNGLEFSISSTPVNDKGDDTGLLSFSYLSTIRWILDAMDSGSTLWIVHPLAFAREFALCGSKEVGQRGATRGSNFDVSDLSRLNVPLSKGF